MEGTQTYLGLNIDIYPYGEFYDEDQKPGQGTVNAVDHLRKRKRGLKNMKSVSSLSNLQELWKNNPAG